MLSAIVYICSFTYDLKVTKRERIDIFLGERVGKKERKQMSLNISLLTTDIVTFFV